MVEGGKKSFWTTLIAFEKGSNMNLSDKGKAVLRTLLTFMHLKQYLDITECRRSTHSGNLLHCCTSKLLICHNRWKTFQ